MYQRLQQAGWSHAHVALLYAISTAVMAAVALGFQALPQGSAIATTALAAGFTLAMGWWLDHLVAVPFAVPPSH
jgi:hypothetical protein